MTLPLAKKVLTDIAAILVPLLIDASLKSYADYRLKTKQQELTTEVVAKEIIEHG